MARKRGEGSIVRLGQMKPKTVHQYLASLGMRYGRAGTLPRTVPTDHVLVHNQVRHKPTTPSGVNGFRWWTQPPQPDHLVLCECGWASSVERHYRVRLEGK